MRKEHRKLLKELEQQDATIIRTKKGWKIRPPDKTKPIVQIHETPSDHRSWANMIADLRKAGFKL